VASLDKDLPIFGVRTLRASLGVALAQERLLAGLLAAFALLALILSAAGLYSVVAMTAQSRRREWGIRMALGAQAGDVLRLVQRQGVTLAATGLVGGLAIAVVATRFARALLFGVAPTDPLTYAAVVAWVDAVLFVLRVCCRLDHTVEGGENLPSTASVVLMKHSSAWETLAQLKMFPQQTWVLKRELLSIPMFGWALRMLKPIAISWPSRSSWPASRVVPRAGFQLA
jgi:ABC-type antimicrobial peptide transport system permease subunit